MTPARGIALNSVSALTYSHAHGKKLAGVIDYCRNSFGEPWLMSGSLLKNLAPRRTGELLMEDQLTEVAMGNDKIRCSVRVIVSTSSSARLCG